MKDILDKMLQDARRYLVPEGLPGREQLLAALPEDATSLWQELTPIQAFFVLESAPTYLEQAPPDVARAAYCAALGSLPGEWFTPYSSLVTATSRRMIGIDGIDGCLLAQLDNDTLVAFGDSEPHAEASLARYQVADLAALFLCARHGLAYDIRAPLETRVARRDELRQLLSASP